MENKVIFESEEEAIKMITTCIHVNTHVKQIDLDATIFHLKEKGYIRKSVVEEAEEMYLSNVRPFAMNFENMGVAKEVLQERLNCVHKLYEAIQEQKKEIERLTDGMKESMQD